MHQESSLTLIVIRYHWVLITEQNPVSLSKHISKWHPFPWKACSELSEWTHQTGRGFLVQFPTCCTSHTWSGIIKLCSLSSVRSVTVSITTCSRKSISQSPILHGIHIQDRDDLVSETSLRITCSADKYAPNESFPCNTASKEVIKNQSTPFSNTAHALQDHHGDDICQPSDLFDVKHRLSSEHGATVDLFQLSSHLQRVEQQRNSVLVKWENEDYCFPTV